VPHDANEESLSGRPAGSARPYASGFPERWVQWVLYSPAGRWTAVVLWTALIFTFSSRSQLPQPLGRGAPSYLAHAGEYAVLAFLFARALKPARGPLPRRALAMTVLACLTLAAIDELHQRWIPGRDASFLDFLADGAGIVLSVVTCRLNVLTFERSGGPR